MKNPGAKAIAIVDIEDTCIIFIAICTFPNCKIKIPTHVFVNIK